MPEEIKSKKDLKKEKKKRRSSNEPTNRKAD